MTIYKINVKYARSYKAAYIETDATLVVVKATDALRFMLGWTIGKVRSRVDKHGFKMHYVTRPYGWGSTTSMTNEPLSLNERRLRKQRINY